MCQLQRGSNAHQNDLSFLYIRLNNFTDINSRFPKYQNEEDSKTSPWTEVGVLRDAGAAWRIELLTAGPISSRHSYLKAASESSSCGLAAARHLAATGYIHTYVCMYVQSTSIYDTASESFSLYVHMYVWMNVCMYIQVRKSAPDQDGHKERCRCSHAVYDMYGYRCIICKLT